MMAASAAIITIQIVIADVTTFYFNVVQLVLNFYSPCSKVLEMVSLACSHILLLANKLFIPYQSSVADTDDTTS